MNKYYLFRDFRRIYKITDDGIFYCWLNKRLVLEQSSSTINIVKYNGIEMSNPTVILKLAILLNKA
jgi:hypothetical protein